MRRLLSLVILVALVASVGCCNRGGKTGNPTPQEAEANHMDASSNDTDTTDAAAADAAATGEWKRVEVRAAGLSIEHRADWATLEEPQIVYQRFSNEGAISVRWGGDATIDYVLAHTGMGSGSTRTIDADEPATVDGLPARRVRLTVTAPPMHGTAKSGDPVRVFVFVGVAVGGTPVLLGYRSPASELAAVEPQLERIIASARKL